MVAAQQGYADVCLELINNGADVHTKMKVYRMFHHLDLILLYIK